MKNTLKKLTDKKQKIEREIERISLMEERKNQVGDLAYEAKILNLPNDYLLAAFQKIALASINQSQSESQIQIGKHAG